MNCFDEIPMKEQLKKLIRNEIRISCDEPKAPLPVCASRIGGNPAVPKDFVWPEYTGEGYDGITECRPLSFMAQINLKDVAEYDTEGLLPKTGVLSFFYELVTQTWGFDPEDKGSSKVYYFPDENALEPMPHPENIEEEVVISEQEIKFEKQISLPSPEDFRSGFCSGEFDYDEYEECCEELGYKMDEWGDVTKLLGYPDVIQNSMERECETVTRGYRQGSPEDSKSISDSEKADIKEKASEWILLFQMGTIETDEKEIMFGDCGHIYFWIKKSDLAQRNFENVWLILQCG